MGRHRRVPAEALVDAHRIISVKQQMRRAMRESQMRAAERLARDDFVRLAVRQQSRGRGFGVGRFVSEPARAIDRTKQNLEQVDHSAGLKTVRMRGYASHRMH